MKIHIFVMHYEDTVKTMWCVQSLLPQAKLLGAQIFVIDNGSSIPAFFAGAQTIRHPKNLFLIRAFNEVMQANPADMYLSMANDTVAATGMLTKLVGALRNREVGIVSPGTDDQGAGVLWVPQPGDWPSVETNHVDNTCWAWRHDLVKAIGWPDCDGHKHRACWASNQDYCYRARRAGYKVLAVRGAFYHHAHHGGQDAQAAKAGRDWLVWKWGEQKAKEISA